MGVVAVRVHAPAATERQLIDALTASVVTDLPGDARVVAGATVRVTHERIEALSAAQRHPAAATAAS